MTFEEHITQLLGNIAFQFAQKATIVDALQAELNSLKAANTKKNKPTKRRASAGPSKNTTAGNM